LVNIQKKTATNQTGTVEAGARGKAQVCDIMHWGRKDAIAHVALIVEVDAAGEPTMTWGKDGDEGELRGIPPDEYGTDWFVDHRNDNLDPGTQAEVDQLRTDYDAAKAAYDNDKTDVHGMFQTHGLRAETIECFIAYLAGHNRPVHEVPSSRDLEMGPTYENEFVGMERVAVSLADLQSARARLRRELLAALTDAQKRFLLSLVAAEPNWSLLSIPHLAQLPAVQGKLQNLERLKESNPAKFKAQTDELAKRFG
jgi:hypothetical protein